MPTYKQVVNHVKKHVLWKEEYFERYYRLNHELVQKRLDKIYQAEDDLMVLISTQLFCFLQANGTLYFDGCYKTGKADNSLLCTNLALWSIELACDHFDIREERDIPRSLASRRELVNTIRLQSILFSSLLLSGHSARVSKRRIERNCSVLS